MFSDGGNNLGRWEDEMIDEKTKRGEGGITVELGKEEAGTEMDAPRGQIALGGIVEQSRYDMKKAESGINKWVSSNKTCWQTKMRRYNHDKIATQ